MKRLFTSLDKTNDGAFVIDGRNRIIFWNQAAEKLLGYRAEEVAGLQCYEILGGRDEQGRVLCQTYCRVAIQVARGDVLPTQDVHVQTREGDNKWLNVTTFAYPTSEGDVDRVIVHIFRDVTEHKEYQQFASQILSASARLQQDGHQPATTSKRSEAGATDLTAREWEVLELLAQALSTNDMAETLSISSATVRNHVQSILDKLGVHSRLEAIAHAYQHGLLEDSKT